jgi:hypothetical protein
MHEFARAAQAIIYSGCQKYVPIDLANFSKVIAACPPSSA